MFEPDVPDPARFRRPSVPDRHFGDTTNSDVTVLYDATLAETWFDVPAWRPPLRLPHALQ